MSLITRPFRIGPKTLLLIAVFGFIALAVIAMQQLSGPAASGIVSDSSLFGSVDAGESKLEQMFGESVVSDAESQALIADTAANNSSPLASLMRS